MEFSHDNNSRCYRFNRAGHEGHEYHYGNQQNYYHNNHHRNNNNNGHHQQQRQQISNHSYGNNRYNQYNKQQQQNRYNNSKYVSNNSYYQSNNNNNNNHKYSASSRQQKANKHQIISIKTETLISKKRDIKQPVFYDPESEIAKQCKAARLNLNKSMFEEEEKQRLLHIHQCNLIRTHHDNFLGRNKGVDSDGFPVTPSGSEQDDDDDDDGEYDADKKQSIPWPATKDTTIRSIMERTRDHTLLDENGRNLLNNDNNHRLEDYGIYDKRGIDKQVVMIPQCMAMDGGDLIDAARVIDAGKTKTNRNRNGNRNGNGRRKGKRRRGGKGKRNRNRNRNKNNYDEMSKEEQYAHDAKVVVDYLHRARQCVFAQNQPTTDKQT